MWGVTTLGAFGFQLQEVAGDRRIVTTTRSHSNKVVIDCVDAMEPHEVIRVGGAGNKVRWRTCVAWSWLLNVFYRWVESAHPPDQAAWFFCYGV